MKSLFKTFTILVITHFTLQAQQPPTTPNTTTESSTSSYSQTVSTNDNNESTHYSSSVSIKESGNTLKMRAKFHKSLVPKIKQAIVNAFNKKENLNNHSSNVWEIVKSQQIAYNCLLASGSLRLLANNNLLSETEYNTVLNLVKTIKNIISEAPKPIVSTYNTAKAKKRVAEAQRKLAQAQQELKLAKREQARIKNSN